MLYKFKLWFDKYYRWIMGTVALLTVALFFVPYSAESVYPDSIFLTIQFFITHDMKYSSITVASELSIIVFYFIDLCAIAFTIFCKKKIGVIINAYLNGFMLFLLSFQFVSRCIDTIGGRHFSPMYPSIGYFLFLLIVLFLSSYLIIDAYYKKHEYIPKPPKEKIRRLSKAERIAQLEQQVKDLQKKTED